MEPMPELNTDRRFYQRTEIGCQVTYKPFDEEDYREAILVDISETGALIATNEKLGLDKHLYVTIESHEEGEQPIQLLAETIRNAKPEEGYEYCYGCMILDVFY